MRSFLIACFVLLGLQMANASTTKKLTAIVPKANLTKQEYKALLSYSRNLGKEIKANWFPADNYASLRTAVKINISRDDVPRYEVSESSFNPDFDASCLKAVERSIENVDFTREAKLEYIFQYKNTKATANVAVPWNRVLAYPFQVGAGALTKALGLNTVVTVPIY